MFEIGGMCIALKTFSDPDTGEILFEKGTKYEVLGLRKSTCNCKGIDINIGILSGKCNWYCFDCGVSGKCEDGYLWQSTIDFAPIDNSISDYTIEELLNELDSKIFLC